MIRVTQSMLSLAACAVVATSASAMYVPQDISQIPLARLSRNLRNAMKSEPRNVEYVVNLARAHAMAWSLRSDSVPAVLHESTYYHVPADTSRVPAIEPMSVWFGYEPLFVPFTKIASSSDSARLRRARAHLDTALTLYNAALTLDSTNVVARLGRGWLLLNTRDTVRAIADFRKVIGSTAPQPRGGMGNNPSLRAEAAGYLLPLLSATRDGAERAQLNATIDADKQRVRAVTPIAVPLQDGLSAQDIEQPTASVSFDADGRNLNQRWSWIRPNAAWLVYDPQHSGHITSALQLFGSVSFWMFWANGYEALSSLDDNQDGKLSGRELNGLALWRDLNSNGVADAGEVKTIIRIQGCCAVAESGA